MHKTLCIDWGNTLVKGAVFSKEENKLLAFQDCPAAEAGAMIRALLTAHQPHAAALAAVAGDALDLIQEIKAQIPLLVVDQNTRTPLINAYHSPQGMGADRLAMAVAAQHLYPNSSSLAISVGTCITYNFVTSNRTFRGGAISPGIRMRLQAMHHFTARLPEVALSGELLLLGYDTETCMRSGAVLGAAAEVHGMLQAYGAQYPDLNPVLTGGDAPFLARQLKSGIFADPYLALRGLHLILLHNASSLR